MAGYRCVNYHELCRLCTNSSGTKVNIFSDEGKKMKLFNKITECLPVMMSESDKLPKIICQSCIQQVETITAFRQTCINAQTMLESCLNTPKLRNGGKVYIKDVTKKIPASTTITKTVAGPTASVGTSTQGSDFLSSIIQAVGIQNMEDVDTQPPPVQQIQQTQQTPQYTFTFDGQTIKSNQIQYKIEEPPSITLSEIQESKPSQQSLVQSVNEFLKLNSKPIAKESTPKNNIKINTNQINIKKVTGKLPEKPQPQPQQHQQPNFNIVLASPKQAKITTTPQMTAQPQQHHIMLPIQFKDESQLVTATAQLDPKNFVMPTTYLQMKLPPQFTTVDGQRVVHLTPANIQLQPVHSVQQSQNTTPQQITYTTSRNSFNTNTTNITPSFRITTNSQAQTTPTSQISTVTIPASGLHLSTIPAQSTPIKTIPGTIQFQTVKSEPPPTPVAPTPQITIKRHYPATTTTAKKKMVSSTTQATLNKEPKDKPIILKADCLVPQLNSAKTQIVTLTSPTTVPAPIKIESPQTPSPSKIIMANNNGDAMSPDTANNMANSATNIAGNPVSCETCGKQFKRKEHLFQHSKLHTGLRPFKCNEAGCNKAFSRKEHLMRHLVSHTGKKLFSCDLCQKLFSRKDNLNKHKRIHPEYIQVMNNKTKSNSLTTATAAAVALAGTSSATAIVSKQQEYTVIPKQEITTATTTATISTNALVTTSDSVKTTAASAAAVATGKSLTEKILADGRISNYVCDVCDKVFAVKQYYMDHRRSHDSEANGVRELGGGRKSKRGKVLTKKLQSHQAVVSTNNETQMTLTTMTQQEEQQMQQQQPQVVQIHLTPAMHTTGTNSKAHDTTVLTLPSSLANIVSINSAGFITTSDMMGSYKIDL